MLGRCLSLVFTLLTISIAISGTHSTILTETSLGTINLCHDLVRLNIASQNLPPNNESIDARPFFQAAVAYAQKHGIRVLTVDRGSYYLLSPQDERAYLLISKTPNLTIDLADSTIYLSNAIQPGFALFDCQRVTLTHFTIDFQTPPYTHVRLESVNPQRRTLTYRPLANWASPVTLNGAKHLSKPLELWAVAFRDGYIVPGTSRMRVAEPIVENILQLVPSAAPWMQSNVLASLRSGDTIIVTQREGPPTILVSGGEDITISNATIYGAAGIALLFSSTSHSVAERVRVMPRPSGGLISAGADGIHFNTAGPDNHIRNCFVSHNLDDALAIDSLDVARVQRQSGRRQVVVKRRSYLHFPNGTPVNFVNPMSGEEVPGATIISQDPPDSFPPEFDGLVALTFDHDLPALTPDFGMTFANASHRGAGSSIEDNIVEEVPFGRGIWIGGAEGVTIARNEIGPTSNGGIVVSQDTKMFAGPPAHDLVIRDNKVVGSLGPMASGAGTHTALAAIVVESKGTSSEFASGTPNSNITIEHNYVSGSGRSGIWVGELMTGIVRDNCVLHWNQHPELPQFGVTPQQKMALAEKFSHAVVIQNSRDVQERNNQTQDTSLCKSPGTVHVARP